MLLGVDIGSFSLKICELVKSRKGFQIQHIGAAPWPEATWSDGIMANPPLAAEVLRDMVKKLGIKTKDVAVALSGPDTFFKRVTLPFVKPQDLLATIRFEAEQWAPFDLTHAFVDYQVIHVDEGANRMELVLAAARPNLVENIKSVVNLAGLRLRVLDLAAIAGCNVVSSMMPASASPQVGTVLLDIGAAYMRISIMLGGVISYVREVPTAGIYLTQEISRRLGLSLYEAEVLKQGGAKDQMIPKDVVELMMLLVDNLAGEAKRSIDFFHKSFKGVQVNQVFVAGGSAKIPELPRIFSELLRISVQPLVPTQAFPIAHQKYPQDYVNEMLSIMTTAAGLALREKKEKRS